MIKIKLIVSFSIVFLISISLISSLPDYFDWRDNEGNWMTSVKQQGSCGSCWAFSTLGTFEAQSNIARNNLTYDLDLSEEYLVSDCFSSGSCCGIPGTNLAPTLSYLLNSGTTDEDCLSYGDTWSCTCGLGTCDANCNYNTDGACSDYTCADRCVDWDERIEKIDDYNSISSNRETIKNYLYETGPISAVMYWDGVEDTGADIFTCNPDTGNGYHAIVITGYNETGDYWIIKNSHGSTWGPYGNGYFHLGFGECDIEDHLYGINISFCQTSDWSAGSCGGGS